MGKLIKMDLRRLFHSRLFIISMGVVALINIVLNVALALILSLFDSAGEIPETLLSDLIVEPFFISLLIIPLFVSVISFSYSDIANGYIKNIAGQIQKRSHTVFSKFVVIGVHNALFLIVGSASNIIGNYAGSAFGNMRVTADAGIFQGLATLLIKWMLCMALSSILMFFTTGIKNKTLAVVIGVITGTGALGLVYIGLDAAIANIFKIEGFSLSDYMPDTLYGAVSVASDTAVINSLIVAVVCTAIFLFLTVKVFNNRDIK